MHAIDSVMRRIRSYGERPAIFAHGRECSYNEFWARVEQWHPKLAELGVNRGTVCGVHGEFSLQTCSLIFALIETGAILVPLTSAVEREMPRFLEIAGAQILFLVAEDEIWSATRINDTQPNQLLQDFQKCRRPGLVVFTSGSTGTPKGILHDIERVMLKFVQERESWRTVLFLMMDHFGGFNTLLSALANGGVGVCLSRRAPDAVCRAIEDARATLLPTTPTFLNLLLASGAYRNHDLSSIRLITYGTEVMTDSTLSAIRRIFPNAVFKQTYGLSELGVLRSKSESADSLWVKIGGDGFDVKVKDGVLYVRSEANMVGYLNAPSPIDADGWMCTGDRVEVRGEYMRILGRECEVVNVGGQKVFPAEVESVLLQAENVREATVFGVKHSLMGQVVQARVSLAQAEDAAHLTERLRKFCLERLTPYKVPVRFVVVDEAQQRSERFKKIRGPDEGSQQVEERIHA